MRSLSVEQCRKYLQGMQLTDEEVEAMRDNCYQMAEVLFEIYQREKEGK